MKKTMMLVAVLSLLAACQSHKVGFVYEYGDQAVGITKIESQSNNKNIGIGGVQ
jgi:uncharacterized protein YcfL